ncbi:MAG: hypothetical protein ACPGXK_02260 [Phycisphaerae bacterium]
MAKKKKDTLSSPELEAAELRLVQVRDALAQAMKQRAGLTGDERDAAQAKVESLQAEEASFMHDIQALKLSLTRVREEEQREKKARKKKLAAKRREAEQAPSEFDAGYESDGFAETPDEWFDDDDAIDRHYEDAEAREREEREYNEALFDRAVAAERREKELARQQAEERKRQRKAAKEAEKQRALLEEKQRKAKARKAEALKKDEERRAGKKASRSHQQVGDEPPLTFMERVKNQIRQFWRELLGKD